MSQQELLIAVVSALEQSDVPYMLTGSFASSLQGEPRATHDVDLVIAVNPNAVHSLAEVFQEPEYYLDPHTALNALKSGRMFNLIQVTTGDKVDFWPLTDDPFDQSRFNRRQSVEIDDVAVYVSSPEDTILMKLRWSKESGGSEKQFGDALHVYEVQSATLDSNYLEDWIEQLKLHPLWDRLKQEAQTL